MTSPRHKGLIEEAGVARCYWCGADEEYRRYHDEEWGRPVTDDTRLFEKLCLEGFQSGLSWLTILRKRAAFRRAFAGFDHRKVARFDAQRVERLLADASIVRHRGKIEATISNAQAMKALIRERGSLAAHVWSFEPVAKSRPRRLTLAALQKLTESDASRALSKDLKRRGWRFVGPTTCYAFLQSMGVVNDHIEGCSLRATVEAERAALVRPQPS